MATSIDEEPAKDAALKLVNEARAGAKLGEWLAAAAKCVPFVSGVKFTLLEKDGTQTSVPDLTLDRQSRS